jgi:hypothetical protein
MGELEDDGRLPSTLIVPSNDTLLPACRITVSANSPPVQRQRDKRILQYCGLQHARSRLPQLGSSNLPFRFPPTTAVHDLTWIPDGK